MKAVQLKDVINYTNSSNWLDCEVSGALLAMTECFTSYDKVYMRAIIGDGNVSMVVVIRLSTMLQRIQAHKDKLSTVKMVVGNFQKNNNVLLTSQHSSIELDYEDIPSVTVDVSEDMMFAEISNFKDVSEMGDETHVSVQGTVRKLTYSDNKERCTVDVEDEEGQYVRVNLWRDKAHLLKSICLKQHVTIFDVKVSRKVKDQQYLHGAVANLHSLSSTTVKAGDLPGDTRVVKISDVLYCSHSDEWYDEEISGKVIVMSDVFQCNRKPYMKCVIGDGEHGILVIIKENNAIRALKRSEGQNIKVTVTRFQVKDSCMMTDDIMSSIEVDDEEVPTVTNDDLHKLLYPEVMNFSDVALMKHKTKVSVAGKVKRIHVHDEQVANVYLTDDENATIKVTLWREKVQLTQDLKTGKRISVLDLKVNQSPEAANYKGNAVAVVESTTATIIQEFHYCNEPEKEFCCKVTGIMRSSIIVRIEGRKRVFECSEEIVKTVEDSNIPCKRKLTMKGDVVISCSELNE